MASRRRRKRLAQRIQVSGRDHSVWLHQPLQGSMFHRRRRLFAGSRLRMSTQHHLPAISPSAAAAMAHKYPSELYLIFHGGAQRIESCYVHLKFLQLFLAIRLKKVPQASHSDTKVMDGSIPRHNAWHTVIEIAATSFKHLCGLAVGKLSRCYLK